MMRRLIDAKKGRTANKLRSDARAAYQTAKAAKSKPSIPVSFKAYEIASNPVAETEPDESQNRPDKHPMTANELRTYWQLIKRLDGFKGALLRLHLLTGGQRIEQLVHLHTANIEPASFLLHDSKGRPGRPPRPHTVPLKKEGAKALAACKPAGLFALSSNGGKSHVAATTLSDWAAGIVGESTYDGHDYLPEKRKALETLHKLLEQPALSNLTPIRKRRA
jgi:integrase